MNREKRYFSVLANHTLPRIITAVLTHGNHVTFVMVNYQTYLVG